MISFNQIEKDNIPWDKIEHLEHTNIFQTEHWFSFLNRSKKIDPMVIEISKGKEILGYFFCAITRKFGIKIMASPFRGWSTDFMGLSLCKDVAYNEVLKAIPNFVFTDLKCNYMEIVDPQVQIEDLKDLDYRTEVFHRFVFDLNKDEDDLFMCMDRNRRRNIRKAVNNGITVEEAHDMGFVDDYYDQLSDVFGKQSLKTPYSKDHVKNLLEEFINTDNILLLRARDDCGKCIATQITLAFNETSIGWGAASYSEYQILRPNEVLYWHSVKYWKAKGIKEYHIGGGWKKYKTSYGCDNKDVYRLMLSRDQFIDKLAQQFFFVNNSRFRNFLIKYA